MCGITGIINPPESQDIRRMTDALRHRGPDDDGYFADHYLALGMRRLAIIDLVGGKQPLTSSDGQFVIFFNGEIYNYQALRTELMNQGQHFQTNSDTEVILRLFEISGLKELSRLRGMFAFCIYDREKAELILVRDFFGIKPLYYWKENNKMLAFSSEIKSFLPLHNFKPEVNDMAVFNYLSFQYNPLEESFLKNVFKLPPAHYLKVDVKSGQIVEMQKYWTFEFKQNSQLHKRDAASKLLQVMEDSVAHHMVADVAVGSFLSGGIDSSIIATLMQKIRGRDRESGRVSVGHEKIKTFTIGFESLSEAREARETSEFLGTDHSEITIGAQEYFDHLPQVVWQFDEPVADPSSLGLYFLAREASQHVKVVLSGEGADELFGGYNIYLAPFARRWIAWLPRSILILIIDLPINFRGKNYISRVIQKLEDWYIGNASIFSDKEVQLLWQGEQKSKFSLQGLYQQVSGLSDSSKMQFLDIHTWLVGDILAKADKMTMAHSLELRVPFLDLEVSKFAVTLPDRFKWKRGVTKYLLREAFKNILPESVRKRRKLGFPTPLRDWLTSDRKDLYTTILENPYIKNHMDVLYISRLIDEHLAKKNDHSRKIYLLLILAIWYNVFIQQGKLS